MLNPPLAPPPPPPTHRPSLFQVGNFFFAGARIFFRSLEAAIFLFSRVARIPGGSQVLPAICTESHITLGAELASGDVIVGQNEISHPSAAGGLPGGHRWKAMGWGGGGCHLVPEPGSVGAPLARGDGAAAFGAWGQDAALLLAPLMHSTDRRADYAQPLTIASDANNRRAHQLLMVRVTATICC